MKRIYVAGNYSADNVLDVLKNIGRGQQCCADLFMMGFAPFCPWHDRSYVMDNPGGAFKVSQFHKHSMAWLEVSDAVFVISGKGNGGGVDAEIERANELGIPVFESLMKLVAWAEEE